MIRVDDLGVTFAPGTPLEKEALKKIDLGIDAGSFVTVIGSNGAGKSTLLGALAGDVMATRGSIHIGDADVTRLPTARRAGRIARVFQDPLAGSCTNLTIEENLAIAVMRGKTRGFSAALSQQRRELFQDRIKRLGLGLENRMQDLMGQLSGGQRQAVSLIMATLVPCNVLLLDEHTAALDPGMAEFVLELTCEVQRDLKLTTLMVTHSMSQALSVGDRTIMLHEGEIIFDAQGEDRAGLTVEALVNKFREVRGARIDGDALLL
ncbi:MAG: ABC transporter ATP-binding protein [Hyphomicrobiales bacterium]|nr:ABC transporter ATP-binding protein [Hyphomicrobiales bacterium]PCJ91832.1 MAG: ABC transporter ATP-binding protein [Hyphomicrobiales bacterium]